MYTSRTFCFGLVTTSPCPKPSSPASPSLWHAALDFGRLCSPPCPLARRGRLLCPRHLLHRMEPRPRLALPWIFSTVAVADAPRRRPLLASPPCLDPTVTIQPWPHTRVRTRSTHTRTLCLAWNQSSSGRAWPPALRRGPGTPGPSCVRPRSASRPAARPCPDLVRALPPPSPEESRSRRHRQVLSLIATGGKEEEKGEGIGRQPSPPSQRRDSPPSREEPSS
jgi:hypothetical protein